MILRESLNYGLGWLISAGISQASAMGLQGSWKLGDLGGLHFSQLVAVPLTPHQPAG